jgi:hypothetical protein
VIDQAPPLRRERIGGRIDQRGLAEAPMAKTIAVVMPLACMPSRSAVIPAALTAPSSQYQ